MGALVLLGVAVGGVAVWSAVGDPTTAVAGACLRGDADPQWELTLGEVDGYGEETVVDAAGLDDGTVVMSVAAFGADGSDVQDDSVSALLGVRDGEEVWRLDELSIVAATEDRTGVLVLAEDGRLSRLDAEGEEVWGADDVVPRHEHDGRLVVETERETGTAVLDVATGDVVTEIPGQYADASGDRILVGSAPQISLVGLDGAEEWTVAPGDLDVGGGIAGVLNGDLAVVGETSALPTVVGLDARTGEETWRLTEELDDGSLSFTGPGPGGTVALDQAGEDGFDTILLDLTGEIAREQVLTQTVYVDGEPMLLDREDDAGEVRLFGAGLEEVASYDGKPLAPCADGLYVLDGEDLVAASWESGDEIGRVEGLVEDPGDDPSFELVDGGVLVEREGEDGVVVTLHE